LSVTAGSDTYSFCGSCVSQLGNETAFPASSCQLIEYATWHRHCVCYTDSHVVKSRLLSAAISIGCTHVCSGGKLYRQLVDVALEVRRKVNVIGNCSSSFFSTVLGPQSISLQWSSGCTLACSTGLNLQCGQVFVFSQKLLRYAALGTGCTLTAVPRSTRPSTLRGTVNILNLMVE